jgi:RNase P subunit RPR2
MCRDDGSPYEHKCKHKVWCRTQDGHVKCKQCDAERVKRAEQKLLQGRAARRQFAANVRRADQVAPRVGYDLVEVVRPVSCPICQSFLQGQRAVRVWVWDPEERTWTVTTVQCCRHHRPGVPMAEIQAKYFETECADVPI